MPIVKPKQPNADTGELTARLKVLADENRLRIIACLSTGEKCVCQLTDSIDIPQNLMSHHLRTLRESGLVTSSRRGRWVYYSLNSHGLKELLEAVGSVCDCSTAKDEHEC
jgi:ArsR family transcriptional regulator, arsenate/arsenite/antimonite-responsive transcriptional repressor